MRRPAAARSLALSIALALAGPVLAQEAAAPASAVETAGARMESQRLNQWFAAKYAEELRFSPITLTFLGRKEL